MQTRRKFLKQAATIGGSALAVPMIVPSSVLGMGGAVAPSERITLGVIGIGGRGKQVLRAFLGQKGVEVLAVCDVDKRKRQHAAGMVNQQRGDQSCDMYRDLRDIIARDDIDSMLIATGDRWHAAASVMAMRAGKDVYCEKPGSVTIAEGQALVAAEQRYGRVFQTGAQRASNRNFVIAGELVRSGLLGDVKQAYAHMGYLPDFPRVNAYVPAEPEPAKEDFDWDLWLGAAPWRDYHPAYVGKARVPGWYTQKDFAAGMAQWGSHTILQCQLDLGLADTSAVEYTYTDRFKSNGGKMGWVRGEEITDGMHIRYANGVQVIASLQGWRGPCGVRYIGTEGWVSIADGYDKPDVSSPHLEREFDRLVRAYTVRTQRSLNHVVDFLDCVRTRRTPITSATVAHRTMTTNLVMDMCLDLQRDLNWDPVEEAFIGDAEADRLRSRASRKEWMGV
ncbi:MAG: Gfo/Idh/MocA family protein [Coraliomargarita sp.]